MTNLSLVKGILQWKNKQWKLLSPMRGFLRNKVSVLSFLKIFKSACFIDINFSSSEKESVEVGEIR